MNDTTPEAARWLRERYAHRSPAERLRMATGMFEDARALVRAHIESGARLTPVEVRVGVLRRMYATDLEPAVIEAAIARLRAKA